jgi:hypothetical protein
VGKLFELITGRALIVALRLAQRRSIPPVVCPLDFYHGIRLDHLPESQLIRKHAMVVIHYRTFVYSYSRAASYSPLDRRQLPLPFSGDWDSPWFSGAPVPAARGQGCPRRPH